MIDETLLHLRNVARSSIFDTWSNLFANMPPIDSVLAKMSVSGFRVLREVYNDPFVFGAVESRKSGVLLCDWNVRGEGADEVLEWLTKLPVSNLIEKVLDVPFFGFQVFEVNWENFTPVEVVQCRPEMFRLKDEQLVYIGGGRDEVFPKEKFIYMAFGRNLYEIYGSALLSKVYYYWYFLKEVTKLWVRYVEKFGIPFADVKMVGSEEEQREMAQKIADAISNAVVAHDQNLEIGFVDVKEKDGAVFVSLIEHCKNAISQVILGHERGTQATPGKLGEEKMALTVREDIVKLDKRMVENFFDTLISYYWNLHHTEEQPYFYFVENEDLQLDRAKRDQILAQIGVAFSPSYWKRVYNLGDEDVLFEAETPPSVRIADQLIEEAEQKDYARFEDLTKSLLDELKRKKNFREAKKVLNEFLKRPDIKTTMERMEKVFWWAYLNGVESENQV